MLWIEKYKPLDFSDFTSHSEIISELKSYNLSNVPNILFYGGEGYNKSTILMAFIKFLYNKTPTLVKKSFSVEINSSTINVNLQESENVVVINPSAYGYRDKVVVQSIIKSIAESNQISSTLFNRKQIKIIVIDDADCLTYDAQAALRRTMEKYTNKIRIFMVASEISKLIPPIKSRVLLFRIQSFTDEEMRQILSSISALEGFSSVNLSIINAIVKVSNGNLKNAITLLEMIFINQNEEFNQIIFSHEEDLKLDWEKSIEEIVSIIIKKDITKFLEIRKLLNEIFNSGISPSLLFQSLFNMLSRKLTFVEMAEFVQISMIYEERLIKGLKPIFHIEAFIFNTMSLLS